MGFFNIRSVPFYIASTFVDFQVERNILRDEVIFPLNKKYSEELVNIKSIDLRWGILPSDSEEKHEEKVLNVCTQQIKRTNFNILLFIGDRYGWIPDKQKIAPYLKGLNLPPLKQISITALEILYALNHRSEDSEIFIYIRNIVNYDELDEPTKELFNEDNEDLKALKEYLLNNYPELIHTYDVKWDKSKSQIVKPDILKGQLSQDIENILIEHQSQREEHRIVDYHLQKILHHYVKRKYLENEVLWKLRDIKRRGVLINNSHCDGTSTMIAASVRILRKKEKSVFYYSEDMILNRSANVKELLQKPYEVRKPPDFQEAERYFLDYMYMMNLHSPIETQLFLKANPDYDRVVVLLRQALKEYIQSKKYKHFICVDGKTTELYFLSSLENTQFLTSREIDMPQHIVYTKPFQKKDANTLLKNLANDSSKEISETCIHHLLSKETTSKFTVLEDLSVALEYIESENKFPGPRLSYEEPEWIKQAFYLLEAQTAFEKIEDYTKTLSGNLEDLRKNLIELLTTNLEETYIKFALSYIGLLNSKASLGFIRILISYTLPKEATELKFAELQNLLKDYCDFDDEGVRFRSKKTNKLIFDYMRKNIMHSQCLKHMISFYKSQSPKDFASKDWLNFEKQLAKLLVEELSLDFTPEKQLGYVQLYKEILAKHVGITDINIFKYEEIISSVKGKLENPDRQRMREYISIPYHMKQYVHSYFIDSINHFCGNGELMLQAFQAYPFITETIETEVKHIPLQNRKNKKLMKEYQFFKRLLAYRYQVKDLIQI